MNPPPSRRSPHRPVAAPAGLRGSAEAPDGPDHGRLDPPAAELEPLPPRRRRRLLTPGSATAAALLTAAIGFYAGVRVEKGQLPASSSAATGLATGGRRTGGFAARAAAGRSSAFAGALGLFGARGATGGTTGGAGAGAGAAFGTVASVTGTSVDLAEASGNTIKVTLSGATRVTKSESVSRHSIRPGDTLIVQGVPGANGSIVAASVSDSGDRTGTGGTPGGGVPTGSGGGSAAGGGSSSGAGSSGVGALFSGGG
jgi:hypothetical protein